MNAVPTNPAVDPPRVSFEQLVVAVRARVDDDLERWLLPRTARAAALSADVAVAAEQVARLACRGGKRLRAALVAVGYAASSRRDGGSLREVTDAILEDVRHAMIAVELLQVYLLIHDDWMDADERRRGGPSVHVALRERLGGVAIGDAAAVLAGDLASAYAQAALLETKLAEGRVLRAARVFASTQEDVVTGQLAEMVGARSGASACVPVEQIFALKTASYTVTGPLALGAVLAGESEAQLTAIERYGRPLGVAFQLRDDLLGAFGDPEALGKPVGSDIRQGKRTSLVCEMERDAAAGALLRRVLGDRAASDDDVRAVLRAMETCGARARVEARLRVLLAEARRALDDLRRVLGGQGVAWLEGALSALGERST